MTQYVLIRITTETSEAPVNRRRLVYLTRACGGSGREPGRRQICRGYTRVGHPGKLYSTCSTAGRTRTIPSCRPRTCSCDELEAGHNAVGVSGNHRPDMGWDATWARAAGYRRAKRRYAWRPRRTPTVRAGRGRDSRRWGPEVPSTRAVSRPRRKFLVNAPNCG